MIDVKQVKAEYQDALSTFLIKVAELDRKYGTFADIQIDKQDVSHFGKATFVPEYIRDARFTVTIS